MQPSCSTLLLQLEPCMPDYHLVGAAQSLQALLRILYCLLASSTVQPGPRQRGLSFGQRSSICLLGLGGFLQLPPSCVQLLQAVQVVRMKMSMQ